MKVEIFDEVRKKVVSVDKKLAENLVKNKRAKFTEIAPIVDMGKKRGRKPGVSYKTRELKSYDTKDAIASDSVLKSDDNDTDEQ